MGQLFQRARDYQPLMPGERAFLRLIEGLVCAAMVAALPVVADALGSAGIDWANVARTALAAAAVAVLLALSKYARAHGDPELGDALDALGGAVGDMTGAGTTGDTQGSEIETVAAARNAATDNR